MNSRILLALAALTLPACGSGGSSAPAGIPAAIVTSAPTAAPSVAPSASASPKPTITPSAAPSATASPTASPSPVPTVTPIPLALRVIGGAPLSATASQLSVARSRAQAHTQAQGTMNGLPILVESSGMIAAWAGDQAVWATNAQTAQDIPETSGTITPSGNLPLNNPGFTPLSCLGSVSAVCIVHPTAFEFGTSSANGKAVGKQTLTIAFADGATGTTADYVYDGWGLPCNSGWAYIGGVPVAQATRATSDVYADCVAGNIVFTQGGLLITNGAQDQYGRTETILPSILAAFIQNSLFVNAPIVSISQGQVFGVNTRDGGTAKVYFNGAGIPGSPGGNAATGMALHSNPDTTFPF